MAIAMILVEPENPDNIGAAARAIQNMGLRDLRLVAPPPGWREKAKKMAVNATSVLASARVYEDLGTAIADCHFVVATTRRQGMQRRAFLEFEEAMARVRTSGRRSISAVVFGRESKGLKNEDLLLCDWFTTIPSGPEYASINLAQAIMIVCFSIYTGKVRAAGYDAVTKVSKEEFEGIMARFNEAVTALEYKPEIILRVDRTFRAMLKRGGLLKSEGEMIKGLSRRILERTVPKYSKRQP